MRLRYLRSIYYYFLCQLDHGRKHRWLSYLSDHIISFISFVFHYFLKGRFNIEGLIVFRCIYFSFGNQTFKVEHMFSVILDFVRKVMLLFHHLVFLNLIYQRSTSSNRSVGIVTELRHKVINFLRIESFIIRKRQLMSELWRLFELLLRIVNLSWLFQY